jgi:transposase-like protein
MENGKGERRKFSAEQKYKIVKEVLTTDTTVSEVCKKYGISSSLFYHWQDAFLQGAREGMERGSGRPSSAELRKIESQTRELDRMKSVIAEITAENIAFKKNFGEL